MKQTLYKYCSISTETQLSRALDTLSGKIYFPTPSKFNDPFELSAKVNIFSSPLLTHLNTREKEEVQRVFRLRTPDAVSEEWREKIGILCLTEDPLNILMWSHYAQNHTGICIGFDTGELPFSSAMQINYREERPKAEFDSDALIEHVLLTKSQHWKYEKEWRVLKRTIETDELSFYHNTFKNNPEKLDEIAEAIEQNGGPGTYIFETHAIRSIFFGARITPKNRDSIIQTASSIAPQAKFFQVELDNNYFWLNKKRLK
ncbi:DUF2971 domain-containing protein [Aquipseudomonas campi]|uniref:DUF2971 domain-containing protein n=1 Tax=Aquipseudomonas campi TaxID=2731681 RepID=A0A6M8FVR0_9GAMM|nr:DUF2971 domain-containing protein [Pseudomonas campi]QKE63986.1 DUF2971 domain-containing protein [Pseudomonas campi]